MVLFGYWMNYNTLLKSVGLISVICFNQLLQHYCTNFLLFLTFNYRYD
jgi:hypothetical protein